ncbi:MAG: hypothetical protein ACRDO0_16470 [Nocardioidaceae bacterium]
MRRLNLRRSGPWIGMAGLVCVLWLYGASALVAPLWGVAVLVALWLVQFVLACRWFSRRPYAVLAMPVVALVVWLAVIFAGEALFGWTA